MPQLRKDPLSDRWVIIAEGRANKPDEFRQKSTGALPVVCPFCPESEHLTPSSVAEYTLPNQEAWQVRVVPNRFPALELSSQPGAERHRFSETRAGVGLHEVIVESREHLQSFSQVSDHQARFTFTAYRDRLRALRSDERLAYALVFKNSGPAGGASIVHTHSQLLAMPLTPPLAQQELDRCATYFRQQKRCLFCDMLDEELKEEQRVIAQTSHFVCFCPYAGRMAYEICLLPRNHSASFEDIEEDQLGELGILVRDMIRRIEMVAGRADYNYLIHSAPFDTSSRDHYHWHIEIFPRLTGLAGFELGAGCYVNPVAPESAAEKLRKSAGS